jgi:hypothetical protein
VDEATRVLAIEELVMEVTPLDVKPEETILENVSDFVTVVSPAATGGRSTDATRSTPRARYIGFMVFTRSFREDRSCSDICFTGADICFLPCRPEEGVLLPTPDHGSLRDARERR